MYATASEHNVLYQYQLYGAQNVFMGMIQTESPYFQPKPAPPAPFGTTLGQFAGDVEPSACAANQASCRHSWGLRAVSSYNVIIAGAGLYSWFSDYAQDCLSSHSCQEAIVSTIYNSNLWLYNLVTIGARSMVNPEYPGLPEIKSNLMAVDRAEQDPQDFTSTRTLTSVISVIPVPVKSCQHTENSADMYDGTNALVVQNPLAIVAPVSVGLPFASIISAWLVEGLMRDVCPTSNMYYVKTFWMSMGDSYASGIGSGDPADWKQGEDGCARWKKSPAAQLHEDKRIYKFGHGVHHYKACSGSRTIDMLPESPMSPGEKYHNERRQLDEFKVLPHDMATLSVGGNDVGFFNIMQECIFRFMDFTCPEIITDHSQQCNEAVAESQTKIRSTATEDNLYRVYSEIIDNTHSQTGNFALFVTAYPRFFATDSRECDSMNFNFWKPCYEPYTFGGCHGYDLSKINPKMTLELRKTLNGLTDDVNALIKRLVERKASTLPPNRKIFFVDYNKEFEGHRLCEVGVEEPEIRSNHTWVFTNSYKNFDWDLDFDNIPYQNLPSNETIKSWGNGPTLADCNKMLANGKADGMDWGTRVWCGWVQKLATMGVGLDGNGQAIVPAANDPKTSQLFCWGLDWSGFGWQHTIGARRIMHPKTRGNGDITRKIWELMALNPWPE
jgi:hypothetical protein